MTLFGACGSCTASGFVAQLQCLMHWVHEVRIGQDTSKPKTPAGSPDQTTSLVRRWHCLATASGLCPPPVGIPKFTQPSMLLTMTAR